MERTTIKTVFLVIGSAIGGIVVFVAGVAGFVMYKLYDGGPFPSISFPTRPHSSSAGEVVSVPPEVTERFLGSSAVTSGDFPGIQNKVLAGGAGTIAGSVTAGGKPAQGLRLRLALNGSVMSQWAQTDAAGKYAVSVPYGKYRIDGYELDYSRTHAVLGGKTDGPRNNQYHDNETMTVAEGKPGRGIELEYVVPVIKTAPKGEVSSAKPVILQWEPYPNASAYRVQLTEQKDERDYAGQRQLFGWRDRPVVTGTSMNLAERGVTLKKGHVYTFDIEALDAEQRVLADSSRSRRKPDFAATE